MKNERIQKLCTAALLCAIGILVPLISPVKIQIPPMSFTLASHVALFLALFISPAVGVCVELGTTMGFLLAGFPPVVVVRAAVQIVFVWVGGVWLARKPSIMRTWTGKAVFGLALGLLHAVCEALAVTVFWFAGASYEGSFLYVVLGLVGVGTLLHSMVDYMLSLLIWEPVSRMTHLKASYLPKNLRA